MKRGPKPRFLQLRDRAWLAAVYHDPYMTDPRLAQRLGASPALVSKRRREAGIPDSLTRRQVAEFGAVDA